MKKRFNYFDINYALEQHRVILEVSGGLKGVNNKGGLESILMHMQNDKYYFEFEEKLTHLVFSVIKHHTLNDANKRTSIALGAFFMEINGIEKENIEFFIKKMENIAVWVAENKVNKEMLQELIKCIVVKIDYPEDLKLKLIAAIGT